MDQHAQSGSMHQHFPGRSTNAWYGRCASYLEAGWESVVTAACKRGCKVQFGYGCKNEHIIFWRVACCGCSFQKRWSHNSIDSWQWQCCFGFQRHHENWEQVFWFSTYELMRGTDNFHMMCSQNIQYCGVDIECVCYLWWCPAIRQVGNWSWSISQASIPVPYRLSESCVPTVSRHPFFGGQYPILVGGLEHFLFSHILGIIIPTD